LADFRDRSIAPYGSSRIARRLFRARYNDWRRSSVEQRLSTLVPVSATPSRSVEYSIWNSSPDRGRPRQPNIPHNPPRKSRPLSIIIVPTRAVTNDPSRTFAYRVASGTHSNNRPGGNCYRSLVILVYYYRCIERYSTRAPNTTKPRPFYASHTHTHTETNPLKIFST